MKLLARVFGDRTRYEQAQKLGRVGQWPLARSGVIEALPGPFGGWTAMRDLYPVAPQTFREWWQERKEGDRETRRQGSKEEGRQGRGKEEDREGGKTGGGK
jgi:L-lactate dehydrogenase complex protein LldF